MFRERNLRGVAVLLVLLAAAPVARAGEFRERLVVRREDFAVEPPWEGRNNRNLPEKIRTIKQDFGYRRSHYAGGQAAGEIGGRIYKGKPIAYYAKKIPVKTLNDRLSASGTLFLREANPSSAIMVGWFNSASRGWRTRNALAFRMFGTSGYGRITYEYGTQNGRMASYRLVGNPYFMVRDAVTKRSTEEMLLEGLHLESLSALTDTSRVAKRHVAGAFDIRIDSGYTPDQFRSMPHRWELSYDPQGAGGVGEIAFALDGRITRTPLSREDREDGAQFNRFGIFNVMLECGDAMEAYLDDVVVDGEAEEFGRDPGWEGVGNDVSYEARVVDGAHDFGYSPTNHVSGGAPGEMGGIIFRKAPWTYFADPRVGPLTLDDELFASGKVRFAYSTSDSGALVGWFNSRTALTDQNSYRQTPPHFLGAAMEGPSRIGHYHRAMYKTGTGKTGDSRTGPVLHADGQAHDFTLHYQPEANEGQGALTVTLDGQSVTLNLAKGDRRSAATFDRFGVLNWQTPGGHFVEIYWDDLSYTVGKKAAKFGKGAMPATLPILSNRRQTSFPSYFIEASPPKEVPGAALPSPQ